MPVAIPPPRPPAAGPALRWGVLGPGGIAGRFVDALGRHGRQRVVAVGSRSLERAETFATAHRVPTAVGSAPALVDRPDVDVVYIATPHSTHRELAELALDAGKHVLIEKPLAPTAADATAIHERARERGLLAMEAMWTRYLPQSDVIGQLVRSGVLGEITHVEAAFGFVAPFDPSSRMFDPALAGGVLLDAGVYPVAFVSSVLGAPSTVYALGSLAPTGVDDHALLTFGYPHATAAVTTSARSHLPARAVISGTEGRIEVEPPFLIPSTVTLSTTVSWLPDPDATWWSDAALDDPYDALHYEAEAAALFIGEGRVESPLHPHAEVVSVIGVLEEARRQLGAR